jgi:hypothetical protein
MPRKKHGYYAKSWFRVGLDQITPIIHQALIERQAGMA